MGNKLSHTACKMFNECSMKYNLHYNEGLREEVTGSPLIFGRAIDESLNELLRPTGQDPLVVLEEHLTKAKINGAMEDLHTSNKVNYYLGDVDVDLLPKEMREENSKVVEAVRAARREGKVEAGLQERFNNIARQSLLAKGRLIIEAYRTEILPKIKKVLEVQKFFSISNGNGDTIIGFVDLVAELVDGTIVVFDNKTSSQKYDEGSVKESEQLSTYKAAMETKYPGAKCGYIAIMKKIYKKDPKVHIQVIVDDIQEKFIEKTFDKYDETNVKIHKGEFKCNWKACDGVDGGFPCPFRNFCKTGTIEGLVRVKKTQEEKETR